MDERLRKIYYFYFCSASNDTTTTIKERDALKMINEGRIDEVELAVDADINRDILRRMDYINYLRKEVKE